MKPGYKHIVWDWNGTLLNDALLCVRVLNEMLAARRMPPVTHDDYQLHFDFPVVDYYRKLGFDFKAEPYDSIATEFICAYDASRFECSLQTGAREVIDALAAMGLRQSILSAYQQSRLDESIARFGLRGHFETVSGLDDHHAHSKLENGRRLIAELGCPGRDVLLIGDTTHDAEVAAAMGVDCVLLASGHQHPRKLLTRTQDILTALPQILTRLQA